MNRTEAIQKMQELVGYKLYELAEKHRVTIL